MFIFIYGEWYRTLNGVYTAQAQVNKLIKVRVVQGARMGRDCLGGRRLNSQRTHHIDFAGEREAQEVTQDRKLFSQTPPSELGGEQWLLAAEKSSTRGKHDCLKFITSFSVKLLSDRHIREQSTCITRRKTQVRFVFNYIPDTFLSHWTCLKTHQWESSATEGKSHPI